MTVVCWLFGHRFYYKFRYFGYEPRYAPTDFCTRCGKKVNSK